MQGFQRLLTYWTASTYIADVPNYAANLFYGAQSTTVQNGDFKVAGRDVITHQCINAQDHPLTNLKEAAALGAMYNSMERNDAPRCLEGTRQSQLSEIMLWVLDDSPDAPPFMWLSGGAGAGKSTIAQTVAELSAKEGRLGASFFFQRGHLERSNVERLLPSIAFQLALSNKTIERHIIDIVANDPLIVKDKAMDRQFAELMLRPLNEVGAHTYPPSIVVLDGLDEASDHAVLRKLFAVLKDNLGIPNPPFRVFISSRPEFSIGAFFRSIPLLYRYIHLGPSEETNNDIRKYLLHGFSEIRTRHSDILPSSVSWPLNEDIDMLVAKSSGHFIYASTVLKFIDYERDHPRNSLNFILGRAPLRSGRQSAFAELDELYSAILSRVVAPEHKYLLGFLSVISSREVDICSAAEAVDIPLEDAQLMLRGLRSVVGSGGSPIMGFLHSSLGEFLRDSSRSGEFFLREDELRIERRHVNHVTHRLEDGVGESGTGCDLIRIGVGGKWVPTGYVERFDRNGVEDFVSISPCEIRPQESAADLLGTCCVPCLDLALDSGIKRRVGYEHMTHLVNSEVPQCLMAMEQSWKLVMAFQIHLASSFYKEWEGRTGADSDVMARLGSVT